jgi:hypothetical protein
VAIAFKPSTLLNLHRLLVQRKVSSAVFTETESEAWPERATGDLIRAVVEMKQRNPTWGCPHTRQHRSLLRMMCLVRLNNI